MAEGGESRIDEVDETEILVSKNSHNSFRGNYGTKSILQFSLYP